MLALNLDQIQNRSYYIRQTDMGRDLGENCLFPRNLLRGMLFPSSAVQSRADPQMQWH
jgi:hypothetical protein